MSDDEQFDRWIVEAAQDYHRPPADIPREAMWTAIRAAVPAPAAVAHRRWSPGRGVALLAAATALVVVAYRVGITTGREAQAPAVASVDRTVAYDVATRDLFDRAEVLLASTQSPGAVTTDSAVTRWARDILGETRLLLDSPAAATAERRLLLEDLELLLVQLVRLDAAATPDDRAMLDRALRDGGVLSRLRTAVPADVRGT